MAKARSTGKQPPAILRPYIKSGPDDQGEYTALCPLHDDSDPSAYFNFDKGVWICHAKCGQGKIKDLLEHLMARERIEDEGEATLGGILDDDDEPPEPADLSKKRKKLAAPPANDELSEGQVQGWIATLMNNTTILERFKHLRGITEETIEQYQLGYHRGKRAYTIPVRNKEGKLSNVRFYRPDAKGKIPKYQNLTGHGERALFPIKSLLESDDIVLCEGELDALLLNQKGIPAVTNTGGAKNWQPKWNQYFKGKRVWVVFDRDAPGQLGTRRVLQNLRDLVQAIYVIELPFEFQTDHGADVTDFFVKEGKALSEFKDLMEAAARPVDQKKAESVGTAIQVKVGESLDPNLVGKTLELKGMVIGRGTTTHAVPRSIEYKCTMDASPNKCQICPMYEASGEMETDIEATEPYLLKFKDVTDEKVADLLREYLAIQKCNRMTQDVTRKWSMETLLVRDEIDDDDEATADHSQRQIVAVGPHDTKPSESIRFIGTPVSNPKDQTNVFQAWETHHDRAAFEAFRMTPDISKELEVFQANGTTVPQKLADIAEDLRGHVTGINGRPAMHVAMDLVYHSVISFDFAGRRVDKGWLDVLVLGDTRTGKSETAQQLSRHYGYGTMLSCESATFAGIFGGVAQRFNEWMVTWGAIPLNDRRIVILDEVSSLRVEEIAQLSSVRSNGIARLSKIETQEARARTRLIWIANPRDGRNIQDAGTGVRAIKPLVGNNEDIARFDYAITIDKRDVQYEEITQERDDGEARYSQSASRNLILWVWSRRADQVVFTKDAELAVTKAGKELSERYIEEPPLIQAANVRYKLARIAVAMAGRLFSTDVTHEKIVVRREHAIAAKKFLERLYADFSFGYLSESMRNKNLENRASNYKDEFKRWLDTTASGLAHFLQSANSPFSRTEIENGTGSTPEAAKNWIHQMTKSNMIELDGYDRYRIKPQLHEILRELD